jgi:formate hydrogenlyase subunit 4
LVLPAFFLFLNPFAAAAFLSAIIGIARKTNLEIKADEPLQYWSPEDEYSGWALGILKAVKLVQKFALIVLFVAVFLGGGLLTGGWLDLVWFVALVVATALIVALVGRGRPRTAADRQLHFFVRTSMVCALLATVFTVVVFHFDLPWVALV